MNKNTLFGVSVKYLITFAAIIQLFNFYYENRKSKIL